LQAANGLVGQIAPLRTADHEISPWAPTRPFHDVPQRIILDLDATDDPLHGHQEGRFFHGYYRCYCYLPLYIFDGRHLLVAKLRRADIDAAAGAKEEIARIVAHVRQAWPQVEIWLGPTVGSPARS
jgi:hypothetical protein